MSEGANTLALRAAAADAAGRSVNRVGERVDTAGGVSICPQPSLTNEAETATAAAGKSSSNTVAARAAFMHRFSCALLRAMARHGWGIRRVADHVGYTPSMVYKWLNEQNEPGAFALHLLEQAFGEPFRADVHGSPSFTIVG